MEKRLDEILQECTVRIEVPNGYGYGTGFFIAPNVVVTCNHVVKQAIDKKVWIYPFNSPDCIDAEIKYNAFDRDIDLAILWIKSKRNNIFYRCVYLGYEIEPRDNCFTFGYTEPQKGYPKGDPVTLECEGIALGKHEVIKLKGGQVLSGLSGSPLLNQRTGKVCGVIRQTRNQGSDLGGEAIPTDIIFSEISTLKELHDEFHQVNRQWIELLKFDSEPFSSDWSYLDLKRSRFLSYFKALIFLVCTSIKWLFMGFYAPRAFPIETMKKLFEHTFKGRLGKEINNQRKELTCRLDSEVDFEETGQARIINQLLSQSNVLFALIEILVDDEQTLASVSRLSWAAELICEQKDLLNDLKKKEGNYYPKLELLKKSLPFLKSSFDKDMYLKSDRILGRLVAQHTDTHFLLFHSLNNALVYLIELLRKSPMLGLFFLDLFLLCFRGLNFEESYISQQDKDEIYIEKTNAIFQELENTIIKNPKLKILRKTKILLESVVGEPIKGGKYRAWGKKTVFHFSRRCKLYPERARPHEMKKIQRYASFEEARKKHKACKICINAERKAAERKTLSDEYFLGEDYPGE